MRDNVQVAGPVAWRAGTPAGNGRVRHRGPALGLILLAQLLVVIDVSIVTLALPAIQRGLGFSPAGLQWVISAYALAFGGFLLLGGRLADLLGRRADPDRRGGLVYCRLAGLRAGPLARDAGGRPRRRGAGRGDDGPGGDVADPGDLPGRRGA